MANAQNGDVLLAIALYTVQIYGDFSGYTDMGRGASRMIGIELPENFHAPYLGASIRDFWRRWHMTLGRWLRDYIYIPLGGGRSGLPRTLRNIAITMTLCGFWHGAAWNFVIWGAYHGALMIGEHIREKALGWRTPYFVALPSTLLLVMIGWAIFRVERLSDLRIVAKSAWTALSSGVALNNPDLPMLTLLLFAAAIGIQFAQANVERFRAGYERSPFLARGVAAGLVFVAALMFRGHDAPFIYFEF